MVVVFMVMLIFIVGLFGGGIVCFVFFLNIFSDFMIVSFEFELGFLFE